MSEPPAAHRTSRSDFRATSDPALDEAADRGETSLLTYGQLYEAVGAPSRAPAPTRRLH